MSCATQIKPDVQHVKIYTDITNYMLSDVINTNTTSIKSGLHSAWDAKEKPQQNIKNK